jgi:hypothetical protein
MLNHTAFSNVNNFRVQVEIIANDQGNRTTPSYVAFTDTERLIGDPAKNQVSTSFYDKINICKGKLIIFSSSLGLEKPCFFSNISRLQQDQGPKPTSIGFTSE